MEVRKSFGMQYSVPLQTGTDREEEPLCATRCHPQIFPDMSAKFNFLKEHGIGRH